MSAESISEKSLCDNCRNSWYCPVLTELDIIESMMAEAIVVDCADYEPATQEPDHIFTSS